ncbi:CBO0543 family protein [Aquibacillus halophilus]|nr:CBO0543 family protein [Aquibacillus halophilus]
MDFIEITMLFMIAAGSIGCFYFIRLDWRRFGFLFIISLLTANLACYMFTRIGLYSFPNNVLHGAFLIPYGLVSTLFPFIVMFGVRYSPERWVFKIPFYWTVIHLGVLGEVILKNTTIFKFEDEWNLWNSYTLWWVFFLLFEILGSKIIPPYLRKPILSESFRYGKWAWIVVHVILILTIFLAGVYTGVTLIN